jgi:hypothetical protein
MSEKNTTELDGEKYILPNLPDEKNIESHQSNQIRPQNSIEENELLTSIVAGVSREIKTQMAKLQIELVDEIQTLTRDINHKYIAAERND